MAYDTNNQPPSDMDHHLEKNPPILFLNSVWICNFCVSKIFANEWGHFIYFPAQFDF